MFHTPELCAHPWNSKESSVGGPGGEGFLWGVMSWISPTGTWHTAVLHGCRDAYHSLGCNSTCPARGKGVKESRGIICTNVTQLLKAGAHSLCAHLEYVQDTLSGKEPVRVLYNSIYLRLKRIYMYMLVDPQKLSGSMYVE